MEMCSLLATTRRERMGRSTGLPRPTLRQPRVCRGAESSRDVSRHDQSYVLPPLAPEAGRGVAMACRVRSLTVAAAAPAAARSGPIVRIVSRTESIPVRNMPPRLLYRLTAPAVTEAMIVAPLAAS